MTMWQKLKLPECLEKSPKVNKIPKKKFLASGLYPVISQEKDLVNGYWSDSDDVVSVGAPVVIYGDHTQVFKLVDFDFVVGADGVKILKPREFLDAKYLYYFLRGHPIKQLGYARHFRLLKELDIEFPSLPQQKFIVAILDEAFAGIDAAISNTEKNLTNARELFESSLNSLFGQSAEWSEWELKDIVGSDCNLSYGIVQPGTDVPDGLPVVRPTDLNKKVITMDGLKRIDPEKAKSYTRTVLQGNELLLCVRGSTGTVSVASKELQGANVTRGIVPIRFDQQIVKSAFGYYLLISPNVQKQIAERTYGAALMQINIRDLRKVKLRVPSLSKQEEFASKIDDMEGELLHLQSNYRRKREALFELKQSLLQKAFSGELTGELAEEEMDVAVA